MHRADEQGVAVGPGLGHVVGAEGRAGAGLALDDDRLAEALLQLVGERAGEHVGGAAGREGHDQVIGLRGQAWAKAGPAAKADAKATAASRRRRPKPQEFSMAFSWKRLNGKERRRRSWGGD
jgi:hypothetical protein